MIKICPFCEKSVISEQEIFCGDKIRLIYPRRPVIKENVMIMPIRCVKNVHDLTEEELMEIFSILKKIRLIFKNVFEITGYNFFVNNGVSAGQHIPHVHFHFYGRKDDEIINPFSVLNDPEKYKNRPEMILEEKQKIIKTIREKMNNE